MTVTIHVMGGLGNQLFQIFTLISYSLKHKRPFYFKNQLHLGRIDHFIGIIF